MIRFLLVSAIIFLTHPLVMAQNTILAAGAGYKRPLTEALKLYEKSTGAKIDQIYGNMGQIIMQAKGSRNVALIVGDEVFLRKSHGLEFSSFEHIGQGILALAYSKQVVLKSPDDLTKAEILKIAMPDEKNAIYGKAGKEFISNTNLFDKIEKKILVVATVPQVSAYLISREVEAGFINLTDALYIKDQIGGYLIPDKSKYSPINIVVGVVEGNAENQAVKNVLEFIKTNSEVRAIFKKYGL